MTPSASETLSKIRKGVSCIADVKGLFKEIDIDGDGLLSKEEMLSSPGCKEGFHSIQLISSVTKNANFKMDLIFISWDVLNETFPQFVSFEGEMTSIALDKAHCKTCLTKSSVNI